jgi:hypothetical protein
MMVISTEVNLYIYMLNCNWALSRWCEVGQDWIGLAQDRYRWRALVNSVMNLWVP